MKVTKSVLEKLLMEKHGLSRTKAKAIVSLMYDTMADALNDGGKVVLKGIGTLEIKKEREKIHKGFGKVFKVDSKRTVSFKISEVMQERLNTSIEGAAAMNAILKNLSLKKFEDIGS
jgi:nucleoid DNA-binding protein